MSNFHPRSRCTTRSHAAAAACVTAKNEHGGEKGLPFGRRLGAKVEKGKIYIYVCVGVSKTVTSCLTDDETMHGTGFAHLALHRIRQSIDLEVVSHAFRSDTFEVLAGCPCS